MATSSLPIVSAPWYLDGHIVVGDALDELGVVRPRSYRDRARGEHLSHRTFHQTSHRASAGTSVPDSIVIAHAAYCCGPHNYGARGEQLALPVMACTVLACVAMAEPPPQKKKIPLSATPYPLADDLALAQTLYPYPLADS